MPKVIHFNYNTKHNVNVGDEAHVLAIQDTLRQRLPSVTFINYPINWLCKQQLPQAWDSIATIPQMVQDASRHFKGKSLHALIQEINTADMVLIGGGGVYMDHLLPFHETLIKKINVPLVIYGAGYNHNFGSHEFNTEQIESIITLGNKATLQSVRDLETALFLQELGVTSVPVCDPAVFLEGNANHHPARSKGKTTHIALNIACHGWKQQEGNIERLANAYMEAAKRLGDVMDVRFYYFVHHPQELKIAEAMQRQGVIDSIIQGNARELVDWYQQMDIAISMMLHSTILAFGASVPCISVGYDKKNKAFMELTGQASRYIPMENATAGDIVRLTKRLLDGYATEQEQVRIRKSELQLKNDAFIERIVALLVSTRPLVVSDK